MLELDGVKERVGGKNREVSALAKGDVETVPQLLTRQDKKHSMFTSTLQSNEARASTSASVEARQQEAQRSRRRLTVSVKRDSQNNPVKRRLRLYTILVTSVSRS